MDSREGVSKSVELEIVKYKATIKTGGFGNIILSIPRYKDEVIQVRMKSGAGTTAGADLRIGRSGCHRERGPLSGVPYLVQYRNRRDSRGDSVVDDTTGMMTRKLHSQ